MKQFKNFVKKHKYTFLVAMVILAIAFLWSFIASFSEDVTDSGWDGVVARNFASGTGTSENPYVISNASEYAYFKEVLEGEDAGFYATKNYAITSSFNYGGYDISIDNTIPFSGTLNGNFNLIYNATATNSMFLSLNEAVIKNVNFDEISTTVDDYVGIIANEMAKSHIEAMSFSGNLNLAEDASSDLVISGIAYTDSGSTIRNTVLNIQSDNVNYYSLIIEGENTSFENVLVNEGYDYVNGDSSLDISKVYGITFSGENIVIDSTLLSDINNDEYILSANNNKLIFKLKYKENNAGSSKAPSRGASISVHASGIDNDSIYINKLTSDDNYYKGLNYTKINNTTGILPDGTNQNLYGNANLATVYIRYSGADINDANTYGTVSVSETISNYYYFHKYPVVSGYVTFDLIDNPWANRPSGRAFNGWVTDYTGAVVSLDMDTYVRSVKIPVSDVTEPISITFYSSWTEETLATTTNELSGLKSVGMTAFNHYGDLTQYFLLGRVNYYSRYPTTGPLYDLNGNSITTGSYCYTQGGCQYYYKNTSTTYNQNTTYYSVTGSNPATIQQANIQAKAIPLYSDGGVGAGYFIRVTSGSDNIYSATGEKLSSCSGTCYKLLQYSDGALDANTTYYYLTTRDTNIFAPTTTNEITTSNISTSRPMTITGINNGTDNSNNRTIRLNNNWTMSSDIRIEFVKFYVNLTTTDVSNFSTDDYKILGNFKNLKIGRGIKRNGTNLTASSFVGGNGSTSNSSLDRYTLIVESGFYQNGSGVSYATTSWNGNVSVPTNYVQADVTLGSDYDRINNNNNNNLIVYYCYCGTWGSYLYNSSTAANSYNDPAVHTTIKSGSFGTNEEDYAAGVYVGGRASGTHYAIRSILVEGGYIFNLIGGPMSDDDRAGKNDIVINVTDGTINMVFGGAGVSNTVGNRILNITGGTVNYSVLGGSNAYEENNSNNPYGRIDGDTLLYVGGSARIGTQSGSLYNISAGSVFGAGNGRNGELTVGSVNNSNIIIDTSADIRGDVYGGGNFGAVGGNMTGNSSSGSSNHSGVYEDGTTNNNIRYFGNSPDNYIMFNGERYRIVGLFNGISTAGGTKNLVRIVKTTSLGNRVWGDTNMSTVQTNTSTETTSGYWADNTYNYTNYYKNYYNFYVKNDNSTSNIYNYLNTTYYNGLSNAYKNYIEEVTWGLGATNGINQTASQFYTAERGSGVVNYLTGISQTSNGSSLSLASFKVGLFYPSDYGFANNDETCLGTNLGSYTASCRNNNWMSGMTNAWTLTPSTNVYSVTKTYQVSRTGSTWSGYTYTMNRYYHVVNRNFIVGTNALELKDIYYTNNDNDANNYYNTSAVYPSFYLKDTVTISSGDGSYDDPYVIGASDDKLTDIIEEIMHPSAPEPSVNLHDETDYMVRTHIKIIGGDIDGSVYGAGNSNGAGNDNNDAIALAKITIDMDGGTVGESIYGGSNAKGIVHGDVFLNITNGSVEESVYGGGKGGYTNSTNYGTYVTDNVFVTIGDTNTTSLTIHDSVYGGSAFGTVNAIDQNTTDSDYGTYVTVNAGVITGSVFGGGEGNSSFTPRVVGDIEVTINGGDITSVFGGNDQAGSHTKSNKVTLNGGVIDEVYGGGNQSSVTNTNVYLSGATVGSLYGGSNTSGVVSTTNVDILSGTVQNVYGGNNVGGTCATTDVNVTGNAVINGSIYGGGNQVSTTTAVVTLNSSGNTTSTRVPNVYGGGNSASVSNATVTNNGVNVGNIFGGSNSSGTVTSTTINHAGGNSTNVYGGNNAGGNTVDASVNITAGTVGTVYGGGNQANGGEANVLVSGGSVGDIFGGGNSAGLTESHVHITGGSITGSLYGGSNSSGTLLETDIVVDNSPTIAAIYGGGNRAPVGNTSVVINGGNIETIYGGGNLAQATGDTIVDINGGSISGNVYGGGNNGVVSGSSTVTITGATVLGSVYGGGNLAALLGDTNVVIDGNTTIGSSSSTPPSSGCVFGGGNQAATGTSGDNDSTSNVNIVGGTIYGNVYGGANTSVVYGNTIVNIGKTAYTSNSLTKSDIHIYGNVFGGGEANASGSPIYDWSYISVTEGVNITIDAETYDNFQIDGSFFGGGNASTASGDSYLLIRNYGSGVTPKHNVSIQRVTYVTIDNSSILLYGAIDRANEYDDALFTISRVDELKLQNNSYLFLVKGANLLKDFKSLDDEGDPAVVEIDVEHNAITDISVDNRVYLYEGVQLNIAKDQQGNDCANVTGMTFFGIFNFASGDVNTGMYNPTYQPNATLNNSLLFAKGSVIKGKHMTNHDITVNGFYSNFMNVETKKNEINYVNPTPKSAPHYMWHIGENVVEYNVNLTASKYSTLGSIEFPFEALYKPNTSFQIDSFDISDIAPGVTLVDKNTIPRIASTPAIANNVFGLAMEASNSGWLTTGKTSFYTSSPFMSGVTYYEGENSSVVPTMLFYLYHSKNLTETKELGTVRIAISAITKISALESEIVRLVVNVNMASLYSTTNEYEAAMTPGDKYELFTSTSMNITTKSKFSAFFGLFKAGSNVYQTGYHRALTSSYVLPVGTKITMLDFSLGTPEYYYHVITQSDYDAADAEFDIEGECSYYLSMFTKMGSLNSNTNYNDAAKNALYFNGTDSSEEFIFIVDFSDTSISEDHMLVSFLLEMRDANDESIINVLGIQHDQMRYNLYYGRDSSIQMNVTPSDNPLYIGYNDIFTTVINYQNSSLDGAIITDTQYFDSKLGVQIYLTNANGRVVSGTDLTGAYFEIDGNRYYPDIAGYTHIKLADKVGNTQKWIIFNTENASLATGTYRFHFEAFASNDGIYYSSGNSDYLYRDINIINSTYGLRPVIDDESVIFSANNNKSFNFTVNYTSLLTTPNIRISLYRREYDTVYDTDYVQADFQDFAAQELTGTYNLYEYMLDNNPIAQRSYSIPFESELVTGTYRVVFRLYDGDTLIGEMYRYIIVR